MAENKDIPVYLITGFLDGGKTSFIKQTMEMPYFNDGTRSLILLSEEGEEEFSEAELKKIRAELRVVSKEDLFSLNVLNRILSETKPERVLIEYNGMFPVADFLTHELPKKLLIYQIITILDGENFRLYLNNIKTSAMDLLTNTDMVIFNRCSEEKKEDLIAYRRALRSVNNRAQLVFEDFNGNEILCPEPDLPYDIKADEIRIDDENFGTFFIDLSENHERYVGKRISFLLQIMRNQQMPKNMFIGGRKAMTCCEADIRFLPYIFLCEDATKYKPTSWANITATLKWEFHEGYQAEGPVFYLDSYEPAERPENEVVTF